MIMESFLCSTRSAVSVLGVSRSDLRAVWSLVCMALGLELGTGGLTLLSGIDTIQGKMDKPCSTLLGSFAECYWTLAKCHHHPIYGIIRKPSPCLRVSPVLWIAYELPSTQ